MASLLTTAVSDTGGCNSSSRASSNARRAVYGGDRLGRSQGAGQGGLARGLELLRHWGRSVVFACVAIIAPRGYSELTVRSTPAPRGLDEMDMTSNKAEPTTTGFAKLWRPNARLRPLNGSNSTAPPSQSSQQRSATGEVTGAARKILAAWQHSAFRGWTVSGKRVDRARVVHELLVRLLETGVSVHGLILAADDVACAQWSQLLASNDRTPGKWDTRTADALLAEEGRLPSHYVVIADELEMYSSSDLAAAIKGVRGILGLCGSPRGLSGALQLQKHIGRALDMTITDLVLDFHPLAEGRKDVVDQVRDDDMDEVRERLVTVKDPENPFHDYLAKIQKVALLNAEEEVELAKRIEAGLYAEHILAGCANRGWKLPYAQRRDLDWICRDGKTAKNQFLEANLRLVVSLARRYSARMELMDAIQEGNLGLIRAVEKYDYAKGYKFSTYATWWIRQSIERAIADKTYLIRLPVHVYESDAPILSEWKRRLRQLDNSAAAEIATALNLSITDVELVLRRHQRPFSLEAMVEQGFDFVDPDADTVIDERLAFRSLQDKVRSVLVTLSEREAGVIRLRFGLADGVPRTLDEIGSVYGVTRERVRQIESKSMSKLRHWSRSQGLRDYVRGTIDEDLIAEGIL